MYAAGAKVSELCRKHGMSDATLYKWKSKYGGMNVSELRRMKDLEAENAELKRLRADADDAQGVRHSANRLGNLFWAIAANVR